MARRRGVHSGWNGRDYAQASSRALYASGLHGRSDSANRRRILTRAGWFICNRATVARPWADSRFRQRRGHHTCFASWQRRPNERWPSLVLPWKTVGPYLQAMSRAIESMSRYKGTRLGLILVALKGAVGTSDFPMLMNTTSSARSRRGFTLTGFEFKGQWLSRKEDNDGSVDQG